MHMGIDKMLRKDKGLAVESSSSYSPKKINRSVGSGSGSDLDDLNDMSSSKVNFNYRNPSSKYDFVKVRISVFNCLNW